MAPSLSMTASLQEENRTCRYCHAERMTLYDVPPDKLLVPVITGSDFIKALNKAHSSVSADELEQFVTWTEAFGQDG